MGARRWTREEIARFVAGRRIRLYSRTLEDLPIPDWLLAASAGRNPRSVANGLSAAHPGDYQDLFDWFGAVLDRPGEVVAVEARFRSGDAWIRARLAGLTLFHQEDPAAMIATRQVLGPAEATDDPRGDQVGDHDATDWMLGRLDHRSVVREIEGKVEAILGRTPDEVVGHAITEFLHPDAIPDAHGAWMSLLAEGKGATRSSRRCFVHPDGTEKWVERTYLNRTDLGGAGDVVIFVHDITERRAQEEDLRRSHRDLARLADEFRMLADEVPAAVFRCDGAGRVDFHNARWSELFGPGPGRLQETVDPGERAALDAEMAAAGDDGREVELRAADGRRILRYRLRSVAGGDVGSRRIVGSVEDVTAAVAWRRKAHHDPLTGILNREAVEDHLDVALAAGEPLVVAFVDLDGFKQVNDAHGHAAGDAVLRTVAQRLVAAVRPGDAVGRYGGDEFVVVWAGGDGSVAERLAEVIGHPVAVGGGQWCPRASIGTAVARPVEDRAALLARADQAMYGVKRSRGRVDLTSLPGGS